MALICRTMKHFAPSPEKGEGPAAVHSVNIPLSHLDSDPIYPALCFRSEAFMHPSTRERLAFDSDPPIDFMRALSDLKKLDTGA